MERGALLGASFFLYLRNQALKSVAENHARCNFVPPFPILVIN
jgi:hypothetical protein